MTEAREEAGLGLQILRMAFRGQGKRNARIDKAARSFRLRPAEVTALLRLHLGRTSVKELAQALVLRPNGTSVLVDRLVRRGLVSRMGRPNDRRVVEVDLTDSGSSLVAELVPHIEPQLDAHLEPLSTGEREQWFSLLRKVADRPTESREGQRGGRNGKRTQVLDGLTGTAQYPLLASMAWQNEITALEPTCVEFDLLPAEVAALLHLSCGSSTVSELAVASGIHQNGASVLVERLSVRGLVKRRRRSNDRRVVEVMLTDSARSLAERLAVAADRQMDSLFSHFSQEERRELLHLCKRRYPMGPGHQTPGVRSGA